MRWRRSGSSFRKPGTPKHLRPQRTVLCTQDLQFLEKLAREFDIAEPTRGNELSIANGRGVDVHAGIGVPGYVRTQVIEPVAGVAPASQETDSRNRHSRRANGRDRDVGRIKPL